MVREKIDIVSVYEEQGDKNLEMEKIKEKCTEGKNVIIGDDFNIRIGELGGEDLENERIDVARIR